MKTYCHEWDIIPMILDIILLITISIIGYSTIKHLQALSKLNRLIKYMYYLAVMCAVLALTSRIAMISTCYIPTSTVPSNVFKLPHYLCYAFLMQCLLITVCARLYYSFKESAFRLSTVQRSVLSVLLIVELVTRLLSSVVTTAFVIQHPNEPLIHASNAGLRAAAGILLSIIITIYAMTLFVSKLFKLVKLRSATMIANTNGTDRESIKLNEKQAKMINVIARYISLLSLGMFTSIVTGFVLGIASRSNTMAYAPSVVDIDLFLNAVVLSMQFPFANPYYERYCKCFQSCWSCIFSHCIANSMRPMSKTSSDQTPPEAEFRITGSTGTGLPVRAQSDPAA
eukprot:157813_1